jgi:hypothetical protein
MCRCKPSQTFVTYQQGAFLLALAATCSRFSLRPSEVIGIADDAVAADFDLAAAWRLSRAELDAYRKAEEVDEPLPQPGTTKSGNTIKTVEYW